ncbi:MAG: hypothetical protein Q7T50_01995 [Candidatus Magasanikbacteria bacterium]|nr:hypothetical protein [Candidatus Magasanikbacteria bacterium]
MTELRTTVKSILRSKETGREQASSKLDWLIGGVIYLIFLVCPVFFTGFAAQGISFEKMMAFYFLVLFGTVVWAIKGILLGELNLKRTPLDIPFAFILLFLVISTALSVSIKDSLIGSYGNSGKGMIAAFIFVLFYYFLVNNLNIRRIKGIFWSLLISGAVISVYSLLQLRGIYVLPFAILKNIAFNPIGSISGLTMYLVVILPFFVVGATQIKEILPKLNNKIAVILRTFLVAIILVILAILALLNGFTFWPVAIVSMVAVSMFFLAKIIRVRGNNIAIPLLVFLALVILLVLGNFNITNMDLPAEISLSRQASIDITKSALLENPIFGSGPGTFYYDFSKFKNANFNSSPLWNVRFEGASGAVFELMSTFGIVGTVGVIVAALIALSIVFLTLIKTKDDEVNSILLATFAAFSSVLLFSILFSQDSTLILITVLISVFAVASALAIYPEKLKVISLSFRSSAKYALALAAIFLSVSACVVVLFTMGVKMYMADIYAQKSLAFADPVKKLEYLERAVTLAPYQDSYYLIIANSYMGLANQAANEGKDQTTIGQNLSLAINKGRRAVELSPNKAANNESLALIYENASFYTRGALDWADNLYNKEIELDPINPIPNLRMALINMARANAETADSEKKYFINEAIRRYDESISKKQDLAAAYYGKAIAYEKLENTDQAVEQLKRANLAAGENVDYKFELGRMLFNRGVAQPNIAQNATQEIAENDIAVEGEENGEDISVEPTTNSGAVIDKNSDINEAEQIFLNILSANENHANAIYSLAVLYQKVGDGANVSKMVKKLLEIVTDQQALSTIKQQFVGYY